MRYNSPTSLTLLNTRAFKPLVSPQSSTLEGRWQGEKMAGWKGEVFVIVFLTLICIHSVYLPAGY